MTVYEVAYIITNTIYIFTIYKLFQIFFDEKNCNVKIKKLLLSAYFISLSLIIFITRVPILMLILNLAFLSIISLTYKSSFQKKLISVSSIYAIVLIVELISSASFGFFKFSSTNNSEFNSITLLIFIRIITLITVYLISRYRTALNKEYQIPKLYYIAYFVVLFGNLYLFINGISKIDVEVNDIIVSGIVLITVNVTMIIIDEKIYGSIILETEQKMLIQYNQSLENQMEIITQSTELIQLLKHDFKNHLLILSELYKKNNNNEDEIKIYIKNIIGDIENEKLANSNNFIIDSIINFKLNSIKNEDMNISININVPISINILAHDLTSILGNLIDNSIVASKKSKEKIIDIKIISKMNNLVIFINNSYDGKIINENGDLKTTKFNKDNHGLGITSVKKTLEKYNGEIRIDYTSNMFSISVILPYKQ